MNTGQFEPLSDCWSSEQQPATYYRTAAAQARRLQAETTTPRVKEYFDKMIAHCERLGGQSRTPPVVRSIGDHPEIQGLYHWAEVVEIDEQQFLIIRN